MNRIKIAIALVAVLLLAVFLSSCSNGGPEIADTSGEEWRLSNSYCMRESEEGPLRRVINRTDPELCGRRVRHRSPEYVRILPPSREEND